MGKTNLIVIFHLVLVYHHQAVDSVVAEAYNVRHVSKVGQHSSNALQSVHLADHAPVGIYGVRIVWYSI